MPQAVTRRKLFRLTAAVVPVMAIRPEPACPEMEWVPFGCWIRHEHTNSCKGVNR